MIRRPPRSTPLYSSAASDVYKRQPKKRIGIISFNLKNIHPHDIASFLNKDGIALRAGMHCTQPLLNAMGLQATARVSFSIYNNEEEINKLVVSLKELMRFWS